ncbi:MAG: redoxin domain-containing protein [Sphingobacteriales bacterium]|nr:redoxin domain-containing protein [Sphingobacteriales bacterium]
MKTNNHRIHFLLLFLAGAFQFAQSQNIKSTPFPSIDIQLMDSSTVFQTKTIAKDKPVVFLVFNTTCEHCRQEAADLVKNKSRLDKIRLVMMSYENITPIKNFYNRYSLSQIEGLVIGRDYRFAGANYFSYESVPFCAVYSKKHLFLKSFERDFTTDSIFKVLKSNAEL